LSTIEITVAHRLRGTKRSAPLKSAELIADINPVVRGWGNYYKRARVRKLFNRLNGWTSYSYELPFGKLA
jgi:hypothetical protein